MNAKQVAKNWGHKQMLQNRVNPWGALCAVPDRGTLMGNRGILHDENNRIVKPWAHKRWVTCLPSFKDIKRPKPFSPGNYSELFFLDEATAFAAGHRPCAYCQRERNKLFKQAWINANCPEGNRSSITMAEIDSILHGERALRGEAKKTYEAQLADLPLGAMFEHDGRAFLVAQGEYLPWSFSGYGTAVDIDKSRSVRVLTPHSVVRAFQHGFSRLT